MQTINKSLLKGAFSSPAEVRTLNLNPSTQKVVDEMNEPTRMIDKYTKIWRELGFYERFEQIAAIFLSVLVSIIVLFACMQVAGDVYNLVIWNVELAAPDTFRNLFAGVLTVLIALEFNHSIVQVIERKQSIVQVRIVVQIAILALVRKFILLDLAKTEAMVLIGLGAVVFSLAALHWVVKIADLPPRE